MLAAEIVLGNQPQATIQKLKLVRWTRPILPLSAYNLNTPIKPLAVRKRSDQ